MEAIRQQLESYLKVGESRPFTASGPQFNLPDSYYQFSKDHYLIAMSMLEERLKSPEDTVRCSAYDFIVHLAEIPEVRPKAVAILEQAVKTEGFVIQKFLEPTMEKLGRPAPTTCP